jgi:hypothetical protein
MSAMLGAFMISIIIAVLSAALPFFAASTMLTTRCSLLRV